MASRLATRQVISPNDALCALAEFRFLKGDANGDDLVIAPVRMSRTRMPRHCFYDQLDGLQPVSRSAREACW
jgi:hypothetical protein